MYSPKIKDELIPKIYQIAKAKGMRMTTLVNEILKKALEKMEDKKNEWNDKSHTKGENYE
jgi:predicted DNA-binding protein